MQTQKREAGMRIDELEDLLLTEAKAILLSRIRQPGGVINNTGAVHQYLTGEYALLENEQFGCMFLDTSYALINHSKLFRGTIGHCAIYPREVAREALLQNAVFVILVHNHPAHNDLPSAEDIFMTKKIKQILEMLDICLFDHIIVAGSNLYSMRAAGDLQ